MRRLGRANKVVGGGGVALAIAPFLPWVKVLVLGGLNLFQLFAAVGRSNAMAWCAVVAGTGAATVAFRARSGSTLRATGLIVGLLGGALALYAIADLREELREVQGLATIGLGPYVAAAGCLAMVVGALMAKGEEARPPTRKGR